MRSVNGVFRAFTVRTNYTPIPTRVFEMNVKYACKCMRKLVSVKDGFCLQQYIS
jgi:hypothetical protein